MIIVFHKTNKIGFCSILRWSFVILQMIDPMGFELNLCHEAPAIHTNFGSICCQCCLCKHFDNSRYFEPPTTIKMGSSAELEQISIGMSWLSWTSKYTFNYFPSLISIIQKFKFKKRLN